MVTIVQDWTLDDRERAATARPAVACWVHLTDRRRRDIFRVILPRSDGTCVQQNPTLEVVVSPKVAALSPEKRSSLSVQLLQEQVVDQRKRLHYWRDITDQPAQIDSGYVGQHLVSLVTGIPGGLMRGKGLDLVDGSEVKCANFLDSLDARGAVAPRWNFLARSTGDMDAFLATDDLYLVSLDQNPEERVRARIWLVHPGKHPQLTPRYKEWMETRGHPKLLDPKRPDANFQLFPPRNKTTDDFARHGNGRDFAKLEIALESGTAKKIFHAEEDAEGHIKVSCFNP